jgi:hypothetical protein
MDIKVSVTEEGQVLDIIRDGVAIISRNDTIDFDIEDLKYQFVFTDPSPDSKQLETETIKEEGTDIIKFMRVKIQVEKKELNSIFCPPIQIGNLTSTSDNITHRLYLSFNARSLDGEKSHCIVFSYTLLLSR